MNVTEALFFEIGDNIESATRGTIFGKLCYKVNSMPFICFFEDNMIFKLSGDIHSNALSLEGSVLFDPSKKNRPMKEWIQVSYIHQNLWKNFAIEAFHYVLKHSERKK